MIGHAAAAQPWLIILAIVSGLGSIALTPLIMAAVLAFWRKVTR